MVSRRTVVAGGIGVGLAALLPWLLRRSRVAPAGLVDDPLGLLAVLPGFTVSLIDRAGDPMSDGFRVPALPDGMAAFEGPDASIVLMRNHELGGDPNGAAYDVGAVPELAYDRAVFGGVSRLVLDPTTLSVERSTLSLAGTARNCAGGPSPWGWLSCEEDTAERHGYVFLCDHQMRDLAPPRRIDAYGRFRHEAVAIDPRTHAAYLTEDQPDGCFYRLWPETRDEPFHGELQAMVVDGVEDTKLLAKNVAHRVRWVAIRPTNDPARDLRSRARALGASVFRRGEGITQRVAADGDVEIAFTATAGGAAERGQVFLLKPSADGGELSLIAEAVSEAELDMPDNVSFGPLGHVFIAEDGTEPNGIRVLCPSGKILTLAVNRGPGEVAGVCLSPRGDVLFGNLQQRGVTFAIKGPFAELG